MQWMHVFLVLLAGLPLFSHSANIKPETKKTVYTLTNEPIDVVIPCSPKDREKLDLCIEGIRSNGENIRRIIVVSSEKMTDKAEWFDETKYPFNKRDIAMATLAFNNEEEATHYLNSSGQRIGWIYQQLLKFYAYRVIPEISSNILILDADVVFLNPVTFLGSSGEGLYNPGFEHHVPYFIHMDKFLPGLKQVNAGYSGISHHMLFQKPVLDDLFSMVEKYHQTELWRAFCACINKKDLSGSSASEYEIYFNFVFTKTNQMKIRFFKWENEVSNVSDLGKYKAQGYHYGACHSYIKSK